MRAVGADLQRRERRAQVVDRACESRQVEEVVDRPVDVDRLDDVVVEERELVALDVRDVLERARLEVVDADHPMPLGQQVVAEMRPEEPGSAGDD